MITTQKNKQILSYLKNTKRPISWNQLSMILIATSTIFFSLLSPDLCKTALLDGYNICVSQLLFALFPFLIAANLLVACGIAPYLGRPLQPICRLLGFPEPCASALLLIALLGGFAPAVSALSQNVEHGQITPNKASQLLPALCFLGPSYIIIAIGQGMLQNLQVGIYLFTSQILASFLATFLLRISSSLSKPHRFYYTNLAKHLTSYDTYVAPPAFTESKSQTSISSMIGDSFFAFLRLCGVILYFQFLSAGISAFSPRQYRWICESLLEVTAACESIATIGTHATFRCCAALSLLSGSILLQIRALCSKDISCKYLLYTRLLHLPLSLLIFRLFLYIPQTTTVYNSLNERVLIIQRLPLDQALLLFIALIFLAERIFKPLQRQ